MALRDPAGDPSPRTTEHATHDAHRHVERTSYLELFGLAQGIALALGIFFVVTGGIGLARGGVDSMTAPQVEVWGLGMTPLLAIVHLVIGVIALFGGASRLAGRSTGMVLGPALIAGGIIALAQPVEPLGWNTVNGIAYLIAGGAALIGAIATRALIQERHVATH